ncbi:hypothetical protein ACWD6R_37725 [Streptomyces sp. NPDC005151]
MTTASPSSFSRRSGPWGTALAGLAALAACAVCCAGPLLAVLGGIGLTSAVGAFWMPALAVVAAGAGISFVLVRRRRRAVACSTGDEGPVDLGMPTAPDRADR